MSSSNTRSWPSGFTFSYTFLSVPCGSITNEVRFQYIVPLVFALSHARCVEQFVIRIGEQVDGESKLIAEVFVRSHVVRADADY